MKIIKNLLVYGKLDSEKGLDEEHRECCKPESSDNPQITYRPYPDSDYEHGITPDGLYDFSFTTKSEDEAIKSVLYSIANSNLTNSLSLNFIDKIYSIVYKPRYVLVEMVIQLFINSTKPYDYYAMGWAYEQKGAYFRPCAIKYYELFLNNYKPFPSNIYFCDYKMTVNSLAKLYEKEYEFEKAYNCIHNFMLEGNVLSLQELSFLGKLLEKLDINKSVDFYARILDNKTFSHEETGFIKGLLKVAIEKQEKGYVYRPRKNHKKPYDEKMESQINALAHKYVIYFKSILNTKK